MNLNGYSLTEGKPWKLILNFALPVLAGILLQQLYNTADTIIVGNFAGEAALSAVGTTGCFAFLFIAIANGFSAGAGVLVAQLFGAKEEKEMRRTASTAILLITGIGALVTVLGIAVCRFVLKNFLAVPDELLGMATTYFRFYCAGLIFQFGYNIISSTLRAVGDSKASLYFLLISSIINVILDILFVASFHMGVAGAAIATVIAQIASCLAAFIYMNKKYANFRWKLDEWTFDGEIAGKVLRVGFPMALQQIIVSFGFFFIQRAVNSYGQAMTASFTVAQRIENYLNMPACAFQITMATYVGQNIGAGKIDRVTEGAKQTIILSELTTIVISAIFFACTNPLIALFGLSEQAAIYCVQHIHNTAFAMLIFAGYFPILGLFQGSGHAFVATLVATMALTTRVICTYTLCYLPLFEYRIIWWNQFFGFAVACTIAWSYYLSGKWKIKKV